jgi:hypothetical protein
VCKGVKRVLKRYNLQLGADTTAGNESDVVVDANDAVIVADTELAISVDADARDEATETVNRIETALEEQSVNVQ